MKFDRSILGLIPARSGSKSIPDKNIVSLGGEPLLAYSIRAALKCELIEEVIVSTDDEGYARIAEESGALVPFMRPAELAGDSSGDLDVVIHILEKFMEIRGAAPEIIVHLRPTTPLRDSGVVDDAIRYYLDNEDEASALRSVHEMPESAYKMLEFDGRFLKGVFTGTRDLDALNNARQSYPSTYYPNGYVDVLKSPFVYEFKNIHGSDVLAFETEPVIEVDSRFELGLLELQIEKDPKLKERIFN